VIAPGHRYALVELASGAGIGVWRLDPTSPNTVGPLNTLPLSLAQVQVVFSPMGLTAVLYSQSTGRLQTVGNLPQGPLSFQDYSPLLPNSPLVMAVSDDAQRVLLADQTGAVYLLSSGTTSAIVYQSSDISALAFIPNRHDAVIADRGRGAVVLLRELASGPASQIIASSTDGIPVPQTVVVTGDGTAALISDGAQPRIWAVTFADSRVTMYDAPVVPAHFDRWRNSNTFAISHASDEIWLLGWADNNAEFSFVPRERSRPPKERGRR